MKKIAIIFIAIGVVLATACNCDQKCPTNTKTDSTSMCVDSCSTDSCTVDSVK